MKFEAHLVKKVDMRMINLEVLKPWLKDRISDMMVDLLDLDDDIVIEFLLSQLRQTDPDPRKLQISLSGFLTEDLARIFMGELWSLLNYAQISPNGIPPELNPQKQTQTKDDISVKNEIIETNDNESDIPVVDHKDGTLTVFLGGVPTDVTEDDIKTHFQCFGAVTDFKRPVSKDGNEPRKFCFLTFQDREVGNMQVKRGNCSIKGHVISIKNSESGNSNNRYKAMTTSPHKNSNRISANFTNSKKYNDNANSSYYSSNNYSESSTSYGDSTSGYNSVSYGDSRTKYGNSSTTYGDSRATYSDSKTNYGDFRSDSKSNWKMQDKGWRSGRGRRPWPY